MLRVGIARCAALGAGAAGGTGWYVNASASTEQKVRADAGLPSDCREEVLMRVRRGIALSEAGARAVRLVHTVGDIAASYQYFKWKRREDPLTLDIQVRRSALSRFALAQQSLSLPPVPQASKEHQSDLDRHAAVAERAWQAAMADSAAAPGGAPGRGGRGGWS